MVQTSSSFLINTPPIKPVVEIPRWLQIAKNETGVCEINNGENPRILEYFMATKFHATEDETPWCAAFVCWCLEQAGVESNKSAWAKSYLNWGEDCHEPRLGAICVFARGREGGHVGFYVGEEKEFIHILGGNQSDGVCEKAIPKRNLIGMRWPKTSIPFPR